MLFLAVLGSSLVLASAQHGCPEPYGVQTYPDEKYCDRFYKVSYIDWNWCKPTFISTYVSKQQQDLWWRLIFVRKRSIPQISNNLHALIYGLPKIKSLQNNRKLNGTQLHHNAVSRFLFHQMFSRVGKYHRSFKTTPLNYFLGLFKSNYQEKKILKNCSRQLQIGF